jgi:hypothetical protein
MDFGSIMSSGAGSGSGYDYNSAATTNQPQSNSGNTGFNLDFGQAQTTTTNTNVSNKNMKQIYSNSEITIYCTSIISESEQNTTNATLHISNNIDKQLLNVKINLFVIKYVSYKVISTSGNILDPRQSFGIKKVISLSLLVLGIVIYK